MMNASQYCFLILSLLLSGLAGQTQAQPFPLKAQNYSTARHPQLFIQWELPSCSDWTSSILERSTSDSAWVQTAIRPTTIRCELDTVVAWNTEYRYRLHSVCASGETSTWYSEAVMADEITHLDLHEYLLPQRSSKHELEVQETEQRMSWRMDTTYHVAYRIHRTERNISGGEDDILEIISRIEFGLPETTFVRFVTDFKDNIRLYSDIKLHWLGVPTIWTDRIILNPEGGFAHIPDSARYIPLPSGESTAPDTLAIGFPSGVYSASDYWFRRGFGLLFANHDISGPLSQTFHHAYWISIASPLSVQTEVPTAKSPLIVISPNPAASGSPVIIQVDDGLRGAAHIAIHDMLGRKKFAEHNHTIASSATITVQPGPLPAGMYMVVVIVGGNQRVGKLVIR